MFTIAQGVVSREEEQQPDDDTGLQEFGEAARKQAPQKSVAWWG